MYDNKINNTNIKAEKKKRLKNNIKTIWLAKKIQEVRGVPK